MPKNSKKSTKATKTTAAKAGDKTKKAPASKASAPAKKSEAKKTVATAAKKPAATGAKGKKQPVRITEVVLRDGHQSLLATRLRTEDLLPACEVLDDAGFWSMESWGGATYDACLRFLGEDPWERLRTIKKAMPKTPQQMLLRGRNLLGYRPYGKDVVRAFVERAHSEGIDVFRIFDAMNDPRNLEEAVAAARDSGAHAQATLSYTRSPVHDLEYWSNFAGQLADMGAHSLCIKDMSGLLPPLEVGDLIAGIKKNAKLPVHLHCHATTGFSTPTLLKAIEAGADGVDTSISSMSMTYGHTPTETMLAMLEGSNWDPGIDRRALEPVAEHFKQVRERYAKFEGVLKGVDPRIFDAQVPGGMLTNMENQLKAQNGLDRLGEVLNEIETVRKDLGYLPLVTPTSQIVGSQAVVNVLSGKRYGTLTAETQGVLRGDYGRTPVPVSEELKARVSAEDSFEPEDGELESLRDAAHSLLQEEGKKVEDFHIDELTFSLAMFKQPTQYFVANHGDASAFEEAPLEVVEVKANTYSVAVDGTSYRVEVNAAGETTKITAGTSAPAPASAQAQPAAAAPAAASTGPATPQTAELAGTLVKWHIAPGQRVEAGQPVAVLEAMKMEMDVSAVRSGEVVRLGFSAGDKVAQGDTLFETKD